MNGPIQAWPKAYFFKAHSKVKNPKVESFLRAPEDFKGLRSQKNLIFQNIFQLTVSIWQKLLDFLENSEFFPGFPGFFLGIEEKFPEIIHRKRIVTFGDTKSLDEKFFE